MQHAFGVNANDAYLTTDESGTVSEILTTDENRAFLTWLNQLWEEGLLDETGFSGLRSLMQFTGILTIIVLVIYALFLVGALVVAIAAS